MVTMFVFGVLANAARHEPEAVATLTRGARPATRSAVACGSRRPAYRASGARTPAGAGRVRCSAASEPMSQRLRPVTIPHGPTERSE